MLARVVARLLSGEPPPRAVQTAALVLNWASALGAAYATRGDWHLAGCVVGWTLFYWGLSRALALSGAWAARVSVGFANWSWLVGVLHGWLFMPLALLGGARALGAPTTLGFLDAAWAGAPAALGQVHCCCLGYLLKDYLLYADGLDAGYLLHHFLSITGCALCLAMPAGAGWSSLNAVQVEAASAAYSATCLAAHPVLHGAYLLGMPASNAYGLYITARVWRLGLPRGYRAGYAALAVLIVLVRCGGYVAELPRLTRAARASSGTDEKRRH
jgi:hypothetical protein